MLMFSVIMIVFFLFLQIEMEQDCVGVIIEDTVGVCNEETQCARQLIHMEMMFRI